MIGPPSPAVDAADIYRLLLSPGERLGWRFRDRHLFWRHWTTPPPPAPSRVDSLLRNFLIAGTIGFAIYGMGVCAVAVSPPDPNKAGQVFLIWLIFDLPVTPRLRD